MPLSCVFCRVSSRQGGHEYGHFYQESRETPLQGHRESPLPPSSWKPSLCPFPPTLLTVWYQRWQCVCVLKKKKKVLLILSANSSTLSPWSKEVSVNAVPFWPATSTELEVQHTSPCPAVMFPSCLFGGSGFNANVCDLCPERSKMSKRSLAFKGSPV